jgi:predicted nucleic acid-binding protein
LEQHSDWAEQKMSEYEYFHVLDLSFYEVANALRYKTSNRFTAKNVCAAFSEATSLMNSFALHSFSEVIDNAIAIASDISIAVYDAAFLSLAEKLNLKLLTLDEKLAKKVHNTKYYQLLVHPSE